MDEIQLQVMVEMVEVHHLVQNVKQNQNQTEIDEIHYMVMDETEQIQQLEVGVETDIIQLVQDELEDIVFIELEENDEIDTLVCGLLLHQIELMEETDELEVTVLVVEIMTEEYLVPTDESDEMLGEECIDQEFLYEETELTTALMHIEVMVEMVDVLMTLVYQDEYDEMQLMVEQYIFFIEVHLKKDVLMFLEVKVDADEVMEV